MTTNVINAWWKCTRCQRARTQLLREKNGRLLEEVTFKLSFEERVETKRECTLGRGQHMTLRSLIVEDQRGRGGEGGKASWSDAPNN